ncbi:Sentrin-specific protease [Cucumispora dikerogammari]|nr:Sentrin-specific protease [Cucumispora dikerogammari]
MQAFAHERDLRKLYELYLKTTTEIHYKHMVVEKKDIRKLLPKQWLNDTLINFYMEMLKDYYASCNNRRVYVFTTFFFTKLCSDFDNTVELYPEINLTEYELLIFPIHKNAHWTVLIYGMKNNKLEYYDSLGGKLGDNELKRIRNFLFMLGQKSGFCAPIKLNLSVPCTQQTNSYDCGVFICYFVKYKLLGFTARITDTDSQRLRMKLLHEIASRKILYQPLHVFIN